MLNLQDPKIKVPVLETERLRLRGHRVNDFANCAAMWADPVVVRHTVGKPLTEEESWRRLLGYVGHWAVMGFGFWVAEEKATGRFVGEIGFVDYKRDLRPSLKGVPEIGWVLASHAHGKGFATEAVRARALLRRRFARPWLGAMRTLIRHGLHALSRRRMLHPFA